MGLFNFSPKDDSDLKRAELGYMEKCTKKMEAYSKSVERLNDSIFKIEKMVHEYEQMDHRDQMDHTNFALDMKYLKEQGEQLTVAMSDVSQIQVADLKKQLCESQRLMDEMNQALEESRESRKKMEKRLVSNNRYIKLTFIAQIMILAAIIVMLLHTLEVIVL